MRVALPCIAALLLTAVATPSLAQGRSYGWTVAGGWPSTYLSAGADWSSDLGADWGFGNTRVGDNAQWHGQGRCSGDCSAAYLAGSDVRWELTSRGGQVGDTYSGGLLQTSPVLDLDAAGSVVSTTRLHLWNVLGTNSGYYGIGTHAGARLYNFTQSDGQGKVPLHWRIDWSLSWQSLGVSYLHAQLRGPGDGSNLGGTPIAITPGSGFATGVLGDASYWYDSLTQYAVLFAQLNLDDYSGAPGEGRADLHLTLRLSRAPITSAIPEPGTWALMLAGLLPLTRVRRRR